MLFCGFLLYLEYDLFQNSILIIQAILFGRLEPEEDWKLSASRPATSQSKGGDDPKTKSKGLGLFWRFFMDVMHCQIVCGFLPLTLNPKPYKPNRMKPWRERSGLRLRRSSWSSRLLVRGFAERPCRPDSGLGFWVQGTCRPDVFRV